MCQRRKYPLQRAMVLLIVASVIVAEYIRSVVLLDACRAGMYPSFAQTGSATNHCSCRATAKLLSCACQRGDRALASQPAIPNGTNQTHKWISSYVASLNTKQLSCMVERVRQQWECLTPIPYSRSLQILQCVWRI